MISLSQLPGIQVQNFLVSSMFFPRVQYHLVLGLLYPICVCTVPLLHNVWPEQTDLSYATYLKNVHVFITHFRIEQRTGSSRLFWKDKRQLDPVLCSTGK